MASSDTIAPNLWDIARKRLTNTEEAQLAKAAVNNNTLSQQLLELVQRKQQQCMDRRLKFKRSNGEVVIIRDVFEKVVRWLQRFKEVGDVATQYDPTHAALPWAAVRMLLQIAINDAESLGTIAEGIETVSSLITRCAVLETIHLPPHRYPFQTKAHAMLQYALVALYTAILSWLSVAGAYYEKPLIKRLLRSMVSSGPTLTLISQEERKVSQLASSLHDQLTSTTAEAVDVLNASFNSLMSMLRDLQQPVLGVAGALDRMEQSLEAKERQQLVEWLSVVRPLEVHRKVHRGFVENTGQWLLRRKEYTKWCESTASSSLWLRGVPGCGKSKLTSLIVQEHIGRVRHGSDTPPVAFCYCSRSGIDGNPSSPLTIMGCILKQLAFLGPGRDVHPSVWNEFSQRIKDAQELEPSPLSLDDCQKLITLITADASVTIIIDGLDETEGDVRDLLNALQHIVEESQNIVKLFVSSRDDIPVKTHLQHVNSIRITNVDNAQDVSAFVKTKVRSAVQDKRLLRGEISPELRTRVIHTLARGSGEMFLWASLNLEQLCSSEFEVAADVMNELEALRAPKSLLETLEQMYQRVQKYAPVAKQITNTVFGWLLVSERQLASSELIDIVRLTINPKMEELNEGTVKRLCRGFVVSENDSDSVVFAHESIREFLQGQNEFSESKLQFLAFSLCLRCLTTRYHNADDKSTASSDMSPSTAFEIRQGSIEKPEIDSTDTAPALFWQYAVYHWLRHYTKISKPVHRGEADTDVIQFAFDRRGSRLLAWQREMLGLVGEQLKRGDTQRNTALLGELSSFNTNHQLVVFVASVYGISVLLERFEQETIEINWSEVNNHGASAVYLCSVYGHDSILEHLLSRGVDPNMIGGRFKTPIQGAAFRGHFSIVKVLLKNGADPLKEGLFPTALHAAIAGGHEPVVQSLVSNDMCHEVAHLGTLIKTGFHYGRYETVDALLRRYFDNEVRLKEMQNECIGVALQAALYEIKDDTENDTKNNARIQVLLEKTPDINEPGGLFGNALQAASLAGSAKWVRLLLERGADPNSNGCCGSAIRAASFGGHDEVVRLLLGRGATLGSGQQDALEACVLKDRLSTLKVLVEHLSLINISDYSESKRQLSMAMRTARRLQRTRIINFLVQNDAELLHDDEADVSVSDEGLIFPTHTNTFALNRNVRNGVILEVVEPRLEMDPRDPRTMRPMYNGRGLRQQLRRRFR